MRVDVAEPLGFLTMFGQAVAERSHVTAVVVRADGEEQTISYADLHHTAAETAGWLQERSDPGDRVLLLFPSGLGFVTAFLGCLYAGRVPVPVPLPIGVGHQVDRAIGIAKDADPALALTDEPNLQAVSALLEPLGVVSVVPGRAPAITPGVVDGLAFLQYTSGSTSEPKGVLVSHRNLADNIALLRTRLGWTAEMRIASWLPMYHDMGLIAMILVPLALGSTTIVMPPMDFLRRPVSWLQLVHDHRAEISCAPNFAYELCARVMTDKQVQELDLSCWRYACNGAEPIDARTLSRFAERFSGARFSPKAFVPGYGLAEATLNVSCARPGEGAVTCVVDPEALEQNVFKPRAQHGTVLVSSGRFDGIDLRIVDPHTGHDLPDGAVGEVWLRGASVASGYWRRPQETERTFGTGKDACLRTGDLGVRWVDELYLVGRRKEMLVVHGRNLYPQDLERAVAEIDPLFARLGCAVFSVPTNRVGPDQVVVVQEVRVRGLAAEKVRGLAALIKRELTRRIGVPIATVALVRLGQIQRTTSGKIQRGRMRELFMTDELDVVHVDTGVVGR